MHPDFLLYLNYKFDIMKGLKLLLLSSCFAFAACSVQSPSVQVSDKGTKWSWDKGTIVVESPERPAGQTSVLTSGISFCSTYIKHFSV
jgi:uncharacterized lipoprotein YajG